ncbi:hypothetical protein JCGZ_09176 [Jatropha curcas]|uniref:F-box domain-containing protein n=1 Tax=Jatropha curcas TaxID=180498 RepID=A0A067KIQ4_JATCU|nr:putative F-box protein At1g32420 [Jatropha curcas]XP_012075557.1 putative F-box protein At1g32420 [Jatropha curcas]XP_037496473.1 putative F-box protein At1g32420 [Jatropha curcas]KDP34888.1 hypothetical protein JCGZ_09176 [Jatropha curcas]
MASNSQNILPKDLAIDILTLLPVKSLMRFKCVSKSWCATIRSSDFISQHFKKKNSCHLLVHYYVSPYADDLVELFLDETLEDLSHQHFGLPIPFSKLHGPCNGIFCVSDGSSYALWNPATKELQHLPATLAKPSLPVPLTSGGDICGFGLDPITNNFKVLVIQGFLSEYHFFAQVMLHTFGTNVWRELEIGQDYSLPHGTLSQDYVVTSSSCYTFLNGVHYWLASHNFDNRILSFHMSNDEFQEIQVPYYSLYATHETLVIYHDSIALLLYEMTNNILDIWVMMEDGSWIKQITVGPLPELLYPIGYWKNDQLILESDTGQLKLCTPNTQEVKELRLKGSPLYYGVFIVKESLVSLNHRDEQPQYVED